MPDSQLQKFQQQYPENCIITELIKNASNFYIVRVSIMFNGLARMNAHGSGQTVEAAEDKAIERALIKLGFANSTAASYRSPSSSENSNEYSEPPHQLHQNSTIDQMVQNSVATHQANQKSSEPPKDLSDKIAATTVHLTRVGWTAKQGQEYLVETFGKRARALLTEQELTAFLEHLKTLPDAPVPAKVT